MKKTFLIKLKYKCKIYDIKETWIKNYGWDTKEEGVRYMYEEGNYSCDCNRSLFIQRQCDKNFPEMDCGEKIKLISILKEGSK